MAFKIFGFSFRDFLDKKMNNAKYVSMNYGVQASYKMLAIHIAASYIANALSKCEFVTYKGGKRTREEDYYRLNVEPNNNQNGSQFWNKVFMKMLTEPEGALVICTDTGKMYVADSFSREAYPFTEDRFTSIVIDGVNLYKSYPASEVFYFKLEDENVVQFINGMYEDYGQAITYAMKAYKKANGQKYKLKLAADKTGDKDFEQKYKEYLETGLKEFIESDNGIYPENKGYSLEVFNQGQQSKDSQDLINLRKDIFSAAGQAFKIPQSMMDGNINNLKDVVNSFLTFAVEPVADMVTTKLRENCMDIWDLKITLISK